MNIRILIIDDDLDMCTLLSKLLGKKGYDADAALSASTQRLHFRAISDTFSP